MSRIKSFICNQRLTATPNTTTFLYLDPIAKKILCEYIMERNKARQQREEPPPPPPPPNVTLRRMPSLKHIKCFDPATGKNTTVVWDSFQDNSDSDSDDDDDYEEEYMMV